VSGAERARAAVGGAAAALAGLAVSVAVFAWSYPTNGALAPFARLLDAFAPFLLLLGILLAAVAAVLGLVRVGLVLVVAAVVAGSIGLHAYRAATVPRAGAETPDLRVLFFNAEYREARTADRVVDAILQADADIVVAAEALEVVSARARLEAAYEFVSPCSPAECELLIASRLPIRRFWRLQLNPAWPARYAVAEIELATDASLFLSAAHLVKPWMSGVAESEIAQLTAQYAWFEGPAVAVGDFNMTPWNRPMRRLLAATGFRALRGQFGTWPASLGVAAFPIDQVLVRDGVRVTAIRPFGRDLTSNHLGFVADLSVPRALDR
jgi:endonuclease/exonuclease/phosphatase (EEP) superfamily protein YafD